MTNMKRQTQVMLVLILALVLVLLHSLAKDQKLVVLVLSSFE